jgi:cytoskeletal protein CcmA (bactofilin family)
MKLNLFLLSAAAIVNAATATGTVDLGTAGNYAILAQTGISTVPTSAITGDIAVSPSTAAAITGFGLTRDSPGGEFSIASQVTGIVHASDYNTPTPSNLNITVLAMEDAYDDAVGRANTTAPDLNDGFIGGKTLNPGVHTFNTNIHITSATELTFSGSGVFIIQTSGSVKLAADTKVILTDGALAENIFWQVAGKVTVGADAHMEGIILAKTDVTFITGSSLTGRILAQTACVLQMATITEPPA